MVTVILLALSTSVGSVISVISISDVTFAADPTTTTNATFISAILASATTCYRKEESEGAGEEGDGGGILCYDIVEAHCYFVDIGRTDREQKEEPKGSG